jgi:hypothetical protein
VGDKVLPARKADNLTVICEPNVYTMWDPRRLTILWDSIACYKVSFTFSFHYFTIHWHAVLIALALATLFRAMLYDAVSYWIVTTRQAPQQSPSATSYRHQQKEDGNKH